MQAQHAAPCFAYPESVRRIRYITNAIEVVNSKLRGTVERFFSKNRDLLAAKRFTYR